MISLPEEMDEYMKEEEEAVIYLKKDVNGVLAHYT
jgi:hypothetical protein